MKVLVLDTWAGWVLELEPLGLEFEIFSVPEVTEELKGQAGPSYRVVISISVREVENSKSDPRLFWNPYVTRPKLSGTELFSQMRTQVSWLWPMRL